MKTEYSNIKQFGKSMYNCLEIWIVGIIFAKVSDIYNWNINR